MNRPPHRFARLVQWLLILYWALLCIATHVPALPRIGEGDILEYVSDKSVHVVAYAGLAFLLALAVAMRRPLCGAVYTWLLAIVLVYALVDELLQVPIPGRYGDPLDWVADALGAIAGLALFGLARWLVRPLSFVQNTER